MNGLLDYFESKFLLGSRWFFAGLALLALTALVVIVIWYVYEGLSEPSDDPQDYFEAPRWDALNTKVLPVQSLAASTAAESGVVADQTSVPSSELDANISAVITTLDGMYQRDNTWSFSNTLNATRLSNWLSTVITLNADDRRLFNQSLLLFTKSLAKDPVLDRLAKNEKRRAAIIEAIELYVNEYRAAIQEAEQAAKAAKLEAEVSSAKNMITALVVLASTAGTLLILALFMVMMRIEAHLQQVAQSKGD